MDEYPVGDRFEDVTITNVEPFESGGWAMGLSTGWSFCCPADSPVEPKAGMAARLYGKGIGYAVRGLFLDGQKVFYRTEAEEDAQREAEAEKATTRRGEALKREREDRDRRWAALPDPFRSRAHGFMRRNPDWRRDHEPYELFVCEQAALIARTLDTAAEIREWYQKPFEEMQAIVSIDDNHSGNTMGAAVHLACLYRERPEFVPMAHGALCPLVGCEAYGCHAAFADNT